LKLAEEGCNLAVNYTSNQAAADETVRQLEKRGVEAYAVRADVSRRDEVDTMVKTVTERNRLDILVGNAGVVRFEPFLEITREGWDFQMNVNLLGSFNVGQAVARYFVANKVPGKVVFVTSFNQEVPNTGQGVYSISKSGIRMLAKTMALELAEYKINVNTIAAGPVITDINREQVELYPGLVERLNKILPLHRWGTPEDMGAAAVFLASPDADYIT
jgi:NAD(P)-dependent dehydrogenase (short-subunit alcohol dehydrogenase family)